MIDHSERNVVHQLCSLLLRYPEQTLVDLLPDIGDAASALPQEAASALTPFLDYVSRTPLLDVQRHYVETFDMRRKCSPYLTYWTHGDTRNRGMALLRFKDVYHQAGLTTDEAELPDHLAVVLEFAALGHEELGCALLAEHRAVIALLHEALTDAGSPYAHVMSVVLSTTPELTAHERDLMQQIASAGPPTEMVGLVGSPIGLELAPFGVGSSEMSMGARR